MDAEREFFFQQQIKKIWRDFTIKWLTINFICFIVGLISFYIPLIISIILTALDYKKVSDKVDFLNLMHFKERQRKKEKDE